MTNFEKWRQYVKNSFSCGWHSNIPWHCILWFATADWWLRWPAWYRALMRRRFAVHGPRYGYIACPWCLLVRRKPNRVLPCDDACYRRRHIRALRGSRSQKKGSDK